MQKNRYLIIAHIIDALKWSAAGITAAWKNELAFRLQLTVIVLILPFGIWLGRTAAERALCLRLGPDCRIAEFGGGDGGGSHRAGISRTVKTGQRHGLCGRLFQHAHRIRHLAVDPVRTFLGAGRVLVR